MSRKTDRESRKQLLKEIKEKQFQAFEASLPMSKALFNKLFNYLDELLESEVCYDTLRMTEQFLQNEGVSNLEEVLKWLQEHGGYCDCEVLANVEEQLQGWNI